MVKCLISCWISACTLHLLYQQLHCFIGPYKDLTECPSCKKAQFKAKGEPHKYFNYIPVIPWLQTMSANTIHAKKMHYWANHVHEPGVIKDVFNGSHYQSLLNTIVPGGEDNLFFYFSNEHDIALALLTDSFAPFRKHNKTCWPIILFSYNLPPEIHFQKKYCIHIATVPGPKKPWDWDSFCWPLVQELIQLEMGVKAFDAIRHYCYFTPISFLHLVTFPLWP